MDLNRRSALVQNLKDTLLPFDEISFAFLFGSYATGNAGAESDLDVGIYFLPKTVPFDFEEDWTFETEDDIWRQIELAAGLETDLVVLNRAPATVAAAVMLDGECLFIRDRNLYLSFFLSATSEAEDFRKFEREFFEIKQRSFSLSQIDKSRLLRILDFCLDELKDLKQSAQISKKTYTSKPAVRRNIERLIENLVNCSIDMAKIILSSEKRPLPQTYRETVENLGLVDGFHSDVMKRLSSNTKLRNILAHEYLDIKYTRISRFLESAESDYTRLTEAVAQFVNSQKQVDE